MLAALWFAERFPGARIFAVEPAAENFQILRRNASHYASIMSINAAVWIEDACRSGQCLRPAVGMEMKESENGAVPTVTIPDLLNSEPNSVPLIVKDRYRGR